MCPGRGKYWKDHRSIYKRTLTMECPSCGGNIPIENVGWALTDGSDEIRCHHCDETLKVILEIA